VTATFPFSSPSLGGSPASSWRGWLSACMLADERRGGMGEKWRAEVRGEGRGGFLSAGGGLGVPWSRPSRIGQRCGAF
jgi:hypothetical protein